MKDFMIRCKKIPGSNTGKLKIIHEKIKAMDAF